MKTVVLGRRLPLLLAVILVMSFFAVAFRVNAAPVVCSPASAVCPYFKTTGGDMMTGGWFKAGNACTDTNYQSPQKFSSSPNPGYYGATMAFTDQPSRTGASSDLGAFSLGFVESNAANYYGLFTGLNGVGPTPNGSRSLTFANSSSNLASNWGGMFEGSLLTSNCIPDYFSNKQGTVTSHGPALNPASDGSGNYLVSGNATLGAGQVTASKNIAYFVDGNVYITGAVTYGPHNADTSPKLVVVAKGDIYINHSVTQMDGWYVAQPRNGGTATTDDGTIWTCRDGSGGSTQDTWVKQNCGQPLTVNGALTAKQINLGRHAGGLFNSGGNGPAEVINYTPEMVLGGGFFNTQNSGSGKIQSLISLPPVF